MLRNVHTDLHSSEHNRSDNLGGVTVIGTERTYKIEVTYSKLVTVFVPDGMSARTIIDDRAEEEAQYMPDSVEDFDYDDVYYKEV